MLLFLRYRIFPVSVVSRQNSNCRCLCIGESAEPEAQLWGAGAKDEAALGSSFQGCIGLKLTAGSLCFPPSLGDIS